LLAILAFFSVLSFSGDNREAGEKEQMSRLISRVTNFWQWLNVVPSRDTGERVFEGINAAKEVKGDWETAMGEAENLKDYDWQSGKNELTSNSFRLVKVEGGWNVEVTDHDGELHIFKLFHR
jgi:hypothetical protein